MLNNVNGFCFRNQFKAHDVNTHILQHPNIGVPKVLVKPPTELKEFNLHPGKRKVEQDETVEEKHEFHAKPIPAKILEQTVVMYIHHLL